MALPVADDFNRANEPVLGGNWATAGPTAFNLTDGRLQGHAGLTGAYWNADAFPADQYAQCLLVTSPTLRGGPAVRVEKTGVAVTCYAAEGNPDSGNTLELSKYVGDVRTVLATYPGAVHYGDTLKISAVGALLRTWVNGVEVGSGITDTELPTGAAGLCGTVYVNLDDWAAGDIAGPVAPEELYGFAFGPATAHLARGTATTARHARGGPCIVTLAGGATAIREEF